MATTKPTGRGTARFAQPLDAHRTAQRRDEGRHTLSNLVLFCLPTVTCAGLMVLARPDHAQERLSPRNEPQPVKNERNRLQVAQNGEDAPTIEPTPGVERRPLDFYTQGVRGNMFSAPLPPPPPKPVIVAKKPQPTVPVMPVNPFADWSYTGTVKAGEEMMALLENKNTKEGQYLKIGESFMGAQVSAITDQMVTLDVSGKPTMLAKSDNITVTPLDKNAPYLNATGQPGAPGAPGMPGMPGMSGAMPQPNPEMMNMWQNMRARFGRGNGQGNRGRMTEEQRTQRRTDRLNQNFNR